MQIKRTIILEKNIREVIKKNGGIMPEDLHTPKKSLKQIEKENKKELINIDKYL